MENLMAQKVAAAVEAEGYEVALIEVARAYSASGEFMETYIVTVTVDTDETDAVMDIATEALMAEHAAITEALGALYVKVEQA